MRRLGSLVDMFTTTRANLNRRRAIVRDHMELRRVYKTRPDAVELHGVRLVLGAWTPELVRNQVYDRLYEDPERQVAVSTLRSDDRVLEIGSGMGYLTALASRIAADVRSFDANPEIVKQARATLSRNGCAATVDNALLERSPQRTSAPFHIHPDFPESSLVRTERTIRTVDVPVRDFEAECRQCTYLLVDIEGAEVDLLPGPLPGVRAICVECHPEVAGARRITQMLVALFEHGFVLDVAVSGKRVLYLTRG